MDSNEITQTIVNIDGEQKPINFRNFTLDERMIDVNNFSFSWTPDEDNDGSLSEIIKFKEKYLSKAVQIKFLDENNAENHSFKGIITQINSNPNDELHLAYQITGTGLFYKLEGRVDCNSFYKKTLSDIIPSVNPDKGTTIKLNPQHTNPLHFTIQYNQTAFDFLKMLAIRYGEWMYYNGSELIFGGKPSGTPVKLEAIKDIDNINIHAQMAKAVSTANGFDAHKGELIKSNAEAAAAGNSAFLAAASSAGGNTFSGKGTGAHFPGATTQEMLDTHNKLQQQSTTAGSVFISASSHNSKLTIGSLISITDKKDSGGKQFIITEIHHSGNNHHGYDNYFTALPAEVDVPFYTNPWLFPRASTQPALVVENEDADGHDRIKVRFPWMKKTETTPWIQVLTPHAGKNKGFRWIPEKDEEVMIDFIDNNAERPVMVGALYTDKNKSGSDQVGNNIKIIGTRTGRRLQMDDDKGTLELFDDPKAGNYIGFVKKDSTTSIKISSGTDDNNFSTVTLEKEDKISIGVKKGGSVVVSMEYDSDAKKITIKSLGSIEITADQDITMTGNNININAKQKLVLEGKMGGVEMKGLSIKETADTTYEAQGKASVAIKGATVEVTGQAMAKLDGGGMTTIKGGIVMIN